MTLVAALEIDSTPMLVGDVLLSGKVGLGKRQYQTFPTGEYTDKFFPEGIEPKDIKRKLVILSRTLVVGVAGNHGACVDVIKKMRRRLSGFEGPFKRVQDTLNKISIHVPGADVWLVGWNIHEGVATCFRWDTVDAMSTIVGAPCGVGSGAASFEDLFKAGAFLRGVPSGLRGVPRAIHQGLSICGQFLGRELENGGGLQSRFGMGFEFVYYDGARFVELSPVAYFFGNLVFDTSLFHQLFLADQFFVYDYGSDGEMTVVCVDLRKEHPVGYRIPPIDGQVSHGPAGQFVVPKWHCYVFLCGTRERRGMFAFPAPVGLESLPVEIGFSADGLSTRASPGSSVELTALLTSAHQLANFDKEFTESAISRYKADPSLSRRFPSIVDVLAYAANGSAATIILDRHPFGSKKYRELRGRAENLYEMLVGVDPHNVSVSLWREKLRIVRLWNEREPMPNEAPIIVSLGGTIPREQMGYWRLNSSALLPVTPGHRKSGQ